jgi:hypothetical protein
VEDKAPLGGAERDAFRQLPADAEGFGPDEEDMS